MKTSIILGSAILFATALIPISAYADDSNLMCRRGNGCDLRHSNGKISISGFDINVGSSDRSTRNRADKNRNNEVSRVDTQDENDSDRTNENNDTEIASVDNSENAVDNDTDTAATDNNNDNNNDNIVDADNGTENDTDPVVDNNNNNSSIQHNSNDVKGFDPFGGLYGPGT